MEDLSHLTVWRTALDGGHIAPSAAADCGRHVARLLFATGHLGLERDVFRQNVSDSINEAMCRITDDLVFTQPFIDHPNNQFDACLSPQVRAIRSDERALREVAKLKRNFATRPEALVHGDLHTGSVMVGADEVAATKVIDPEFCFYGPIAFDLGVLLANLLFASIRAGVLRQDEQHEWLRALPEQMWTAFESEFWTLWPRRVDTTMSADQARDWLGRIARDAVGYAGCEAIRRIVGFAKTSDIQSLAPELRVVGAAATLETAHRWLIEPDAEWNFDIDSYCPLS